MKKIILTFLLIGLAGYAQVDNRSQGPIQPSIPAPFSPQEIFRFKPGIFTQLQQGTFGFGANDRWSSLGELTTLPSGQRLHGLRLQDSGNGLVMGYSSAEINPFLQYIGPKGFDIKTASSFTSTVSQVVATFKNNGATDFGFNTIIDPVGPRPVIPPFQVGIFSRFSTGLYVRRGNAAIDPATFISADFGGQIIATSATFTSDQQFKRDVKGESSSLEIINALKPVSYFFKNDNKFGFSFSNKLQHGFIAQELETILPELVENNKQQGIGSYKSVNYNGIIAILTKSVQELSAEVNLLKTQLKEAKTYVVANENFTTNEIDKIKENGFSLGQNTPNPFNSSSEIAYTFPANQSNVSLMVFNLNGEKVKEFPLSNPKGKVILSANDFKSGLYLYSIVSDGSEIIVKRMLVK